MSISPKLCEVLHQGLVEFIWLSISQENPGPSCSMEYLLIAQRTGMQYSWNYLEDELEQHWGILVSLRFMSDTRILSAEGKNID